MQNTNTVSQSVKIVEITAQRPLGHDQDGGRKVILGRGEANVYARRAERAGIELTREVEPNRVYESLLITERGVVTLDDKVTHIAFVTSHVSIEDNQFDEQLYITALEAVTKQLTAGANLVMTHPGTYEGDLEASGACAERVEAWLTERGFSVTWKRATADLPREMREQLQNVQVSYGDFALSENDLVLVGSRRLNRERMTDALRAVAGMLLDSTKPARLVAPLAVGVNLAAAEAAVQKGLSVTLFAMGSQPDTWAPKQRERLEALMATGAVQVIGDLARPWERGLMTASIEAVSQLAVAGQARVACIDDPLGSEAKALKGAKNFFGHVVSFLREQLGDDEVSKALSTQAPQDETPAQPAPAQQVEEAVIHF